MKRTRQASWTRGPLLGTAVAAVLLGAGFASAAPPPGKGGGGGGGDQPLTNPAFVFQENVDGGLFLTVSDGSATVRLTSNPDTTDDGAAWSPDFDPVAAGHQGWVAFFRHYQSGSRWGGLYTVPSDASGPPVLIRSFTESETPPPERSRGQLTLSWSPDGTRILYQAESAVWAVTVSTGTTERLFTGSNPDFSRDLDPETPGYQAAIAFGGGEDVWVCSAEIDETGELTVFFDSFINLTKSPDLVEEHPVWSADGHYLAFSRRIKDADIGADERGIYALELTTAVQWRVADTYYAQTRPTWSPDGLYIAFSAARQVKGKWTADIFYVSPWDASFGAVNVTQTDSSRKVEYDPAWNPAWVNDTL